MQQWLDVIKGMSDYSGGWFSGFTLLASDPLPQTSFTELLSESYNFAKLQMAMPRTLWILERSLNWDCSTISDQVLISKMPVQKELKERRHPWNRVGFTENVGCVGNESCSGLTEIGGEVGEGRHPSIQPSLISCLCASGFFPAICGMAGSQPLGSVLFLGRRDFRSSDRGAASLSLNERRQSMHFI